MRKELTAPWHRETEEKPAHDRTVIAVKLCDADGRYHGGENEWNGGRWRNFMGIPNAFPPDYWCYLEDHAEAHKQLVDN